MIVRSLQGQSVRPVHGRPTARVSSEGAGEDLQDKFSRGDSTPKVLVAGVAERHSVKASSMRPSQVACEFLRTYEKSLPLDKQSQTARREMAQDALSFFRMYPGLFYKDIRDGVLSLDIGQGPAPKTLIQGDCHIGNFGTVRGAKSTLWAANDFDCAQEGRPEIDLVRLVSSIIVAKPTLSEEEVTKAVLGGYRDSCQEIAQDGPKACAGLHHHQSSGAVKKLIEKADGTTQKDLLEEFCNSSRTRLLRNEEMVEVEPSLASEVKVELARVIPAESQVLDLAQKLGSGGSTLGLPRYYALVQQGDDLPKIVEIKALLPLPSESNPADLSKADEKKIVKNFSNLGVAPSDWRGGFFCRNLHYFVREREPEKATIKLAKLDDKQMLEVASFAGKAIAQTHLRSKSLAQATLGWLEKSTQIQKNLSQIGRQYAQQALADCKEWNS